MSTLLSSPNATRWVKWWTPVIVFAMLGGWFVISLVFVLFQSFSLITLFPPPVFGAFFYVIRSSYGFIADEVWLEDVTIVVRNADCKDRISIDDIHFVEQKKLGTLFSNDLNRFEIAILHLKRPCTLGATIGFAPPKGDFHYIEGLLQEAYRTKVCDSPMADSWGQP
ncbi:hypothetical protein Pan181_48260 [Aeoliella mucimassa]|uniref:Uncharacterized protein n=2 Tax=Aeoliella mucimassa TaxID=2527972 RepID=A0A518AV32_9BACT|nr:hypothetical protein Pan181_48260 [Aeoliella mucimassa]